MTVVPAAVVFGAGVLVGYGIAYAVVRHFEKPIMNGKLWLNEEESRRLAAVLRDAMQRDEKEREK